MVVQQPWLLQRGRFSKRRRIRWWWEDIIVKCKVYKVPLGLSWDQAYAWCWETLGPADKLSP